MASLKPGGRITVGSVVEAEVDAGDGYEQCTVKALDTAKGEVTLQFAGGFVRSGVKFAELRLPAEEQAADGSTQLMCKYHATGVTANHGGGAALQSREEASAGAGGVPPAA